MHVITQTRIQDAQKRWPQASSSLDGGYRSIKRASPYHFADMKRLFPATDLVGPHHVFDMGGNKIRLIAVVMYRAQRVYIKHILDHVEYDKGKWRD
jgi:mRNA interferase HigB